MRSYLLVLFIYTSAAFQQPSQSARGLLLVSHNAAREVALIDVSTRRVLLTLPSAGGPHEITVSRDRSLAYISDTGTGPDGSKGDSVVVLDLRARRLLKTFTPCERPHDTRLSRDGRHLWVACAPMKAVLEMDATTGAIRKTWTTNLDGGWFVEVTPDGKKLYVPHLEGKALTVIDRETGRIRQLLSGSTQFAVTISPNGRELWVSDADQNRISIVDTSNDQVRTTVTLGESKKGQMSFSRLRFTPDGKQVVVVRGPTFMVIDAVQHSIMWTLDMPHDGKVVTVSGDNRHAFVSHPGNDNVSVIDLLNRKVENTFAVGRQPDGLAWLEFPGSL
jgi:YVTN family beta-propeller protein